MFGPKHTLESVIQEILEGLENGSVSLDGEITTPEGVAQISQHSVPHQETAKVGWKIWNLFGNTKKY